MTWYILIGIWWLVVALLVGSLAVLAAAAVWDWYDRRRNRVMYELTRSHKPRKPAAK